ncbi:uncharacterized protein [Palaemon carinicauda]|uniref:uncharacterized protein isoform X1 n=2 Tax=Palaemon carinicauda TaxID=392227 RepID=UPI0035B64891
MHLFPPYCRPILLGLALFVDAVRHEGVAIGKLCTTVEDCDLNYDGSIDCIDGLCQCKPGIDVYYDFRMNPYCYSKFNLLKSTCSKNTCGENEVCRRSGASETNEKYCFCRKRYLHIEGKCEKASLRSPLSSCSTSLHSVVYACDINKHSICYQDRCICLETYVPNKTSGECEPEANYLKAHSLSEYRVKPYEYCVQDSHCIEGLVCEHLKCNCPEPCTYRRDEEVCYCGKYKIKAKEGPIVLGICLGIAILTFWAYLIRRTFEKFLGKKRGPLSCEPSADSSQHYGGVIHNHETTSEITSNDHPIEFIVHSNRTDQRINTSCGLPPRQPENDTLDDHRLPQTSSNVLPDHQGVAFNPLFAPQDSSLSVNSSRPPTPSAPFLPAENSSSLDLPPAYHSLFPKPTDVSAPSSSYPLK